VDGGSVPLGCAVRDRKLVVDEAETARVRRVFERFVAMGSSTKLVPLLRAEGVLTKTGRPFDKGSIYKLLNNRTYLGEVTHKGKACPGEHRAIVPWELWDAAHTILRESPRMRANGNRSQTPALLRGLIFGPDGRATSTTHTQRRGRLYGYYVSQAVLKAARTAAARCGGCPRPRSRPRWYSRCGRCCVCRRWRWAPGGWRAPMLRT
jgi:Recombinase